MLFRLKAPDAVYRAAKDFWDAFEGEATVESWPAGNTYVNHWVTPTQMLSLEDARFQPMGQRAKQLIWSGAQPVLEAWTGQKLKPTSLYGIRLYGSESILATHVDRLPLVTSAIINVAQDADEPWPVEVVGHDGRAYNVTLEPGEMALYESHTVLHGRPVPLKGRLFANVFVHFMPIDQKDSKKNEPGVDMDWERHARSELKDPALARTLAEKRSSWPTPVPAAVSTQWAVDAARKHDAENPYDPLPVRNKVTRRASEEGGGSLLDNMKKKKKNRAERRIEAGRAAGHMKAGAASEEEEEEEAGHQVVGGEDFGEHSFSTGSHIATHIAAAEGDLAALLAAVDRDPDSVNSADENFWTPLHEAARSGKSLAVVKALVDHGADLGAKTFGGGSALWLAKHFDHVDVARYLEALGAPESQDEEL